MPKLGLGLSLPQTRVAGGFTPNKISDLSLWLDAGIGVIQSGGDVSDWYDQSGNNLNFNAVTGYTYANSNPVVYPTAINGKPALYFLNSLMLSSSTNICTTGNGFTIFIVGYSNGDGVVGGNGGDLQPYICYSDLASQAFDSWTVHAYCGSGTDAGAADISTDDGTTYSSLTYTNAVGTPRIITASFGGGTLSAYINGSLYQDTSAETPQALNKPIGIGNRSIIDEGNEPGFRENFDGYISEIVIYNKELTSANRQKVEAYLNTKYAIY